jgi:hypothetical protein
MSDIRLRHATSVAAKPAAIQPARETAARTEQDPATIEELTRNILAFLDKSFLILWDAGIPSLKSRVGDNIDFYRAVHRLPGSYGQINNVEVASGKFRRVFTVRLVFSNIFHPL